MLFRAVFAAALFGLVPAYASAETPEAGAAPAECPAEAEQTLFNLFHAAQAGTISDGNTVYSYAETARQLCAELGEVQGILAKQYASEYRLASDRGDNEAKNFNQIMRMQTDLREAYPTLGQ